LIGICVGVLIYNFFEGETLVSDLLLTRKLLKSSLTKLDDRASKHHDKSEIVISLTTLPSRIGHIDLTLKSLLQQSIPPARIYLNVPAYSKREKCAYEVPPHIQKLKTVEIVPCEDYGPATKVIPTLFNMPPDQPIFVVDDDRIYHPNLIADLDAAIKVRTDTVFGFSGWIVPEDLIDRPTKILSNLLMRSPAPVRASRLSQPYPVDIIQGMSGYCVRPCFFPDLAALTNYSVAPEAAFFVDDVWISGHCSAPRSIIPARHGNFERLSTARFYKNTSLALVNRGTGGDENRHNSIMAKYFEGKWPVGGKQKP
jgi:hypothetical protein